VLPEIQQRNTNETQHSTTLARTWYTDHPSQTIIRILRPRWKFRNDLLCLGLLRHQQAGQKGRLGLGK